MQIYDNYVLYSELTTKAKVSSSCLRQLKDIHIEYMGRAPIIKVSSLNEKYKKIAKECTNLKNYQTYTTFAIEVGKHKDYFHCMEAQGLRKFTSLRIGGYKLIELSDEFVKLIKNGYSPFIIGIQNKSDEEFAKYKVDMQGLTFGFY